MSHRIKGRHKPRHHTHAVKPVHATILKPLRTEASDIVETPVTEVKAKAKIAAKEVIAPALAEPALA